MNDVLRLVLLLAIVGAGLTGLGAVIARRLEMRRRLRRYLEQALKAEPEAVLTDRGAGRALAFNLDAGALAVLWDKGRKGLVYRFGQLMGGELIVDDTVVMRVFQGQPPRPLDQIPRDAERAVLRLVFDNPRDPEYEIELWPAMLGRATEHPSLSEAVQAGRRWLTGIEAIQRRPAAPRTLTRPAPPKVLAEETDSPPWDDDEQL